MFIKSYLIKQRTQEMANNYFKNSTTEELIDLIKTLAAASAQASREGNSSTAIDDTMVNAANEIAARDLS